MSKDLTAWFTIAPLGIIRYRFPKHELLYGLLDVVKREACGRITVVYDYGYDGDGCGRPAIFVLEKLHWVLFGWLPDDDVIDDDRVEKVYSAMLSLLKWWCTPLYIRGLGGATKDEEVYEYGFVCREGEKVVYRFATVDGYARWEELEIGGH